MSAIYERAKTTKCFLGWYQIFGKSGLYASRITLIMHNGESGYKQSLYEAL